MSKIIYRNFAGEKYAFTSSDDSTAVLGIPTEEVTVPYAVTQLDSSFNSNYPPRVARTPHGHYLLYGGPTTGALFGGTAYWKNTDKYNDYLLLGQGSGGAGTGTISSHTINGITCYYYNANTAGVTVDPVLEFADHMEPYHSYDIERDLQWPGGSSW
jgi:hypothetical protein